jgi:hypothetical protein
MTRKNSFAVPRRTFMKAAAGFGGASLFGGISFRAFAQAAALAPADHCFVFAYFNGGWDVLLSLDPRDPDVFTADRIAETRILPGYSLLANDPSFPTTVVRPETRPGAAPSNILYGPAIGRMGQHYDLSAVVRGINMNTVAHDVGFRYFLTGKEPIGSAARGSSTATEIVGQMSPRVPVPSIAFGIETYNDRYPGSANALRVSNQRDLLLTLAPSPTALDSEIERQLVNLKGQPVTCEADLYDSRGLVSQYSQSRGQMRDVLTGQLDKFFSFATNAADSMAVAEEKAAVRAKYGLATNDNGASSGSRAAMVAQALKKGVAQCVSINITGGLDTHFGTQTTHAQRQRDGWNALGDLVSDLRATAHPTGGTFMDHTTVLVFSEFSRTPLINASGGRDHHITNSALLVGRGIKHNVVFGKSGDVAMSAGIVDHHGNGKVVDQILPENVIATVLASARRPDGSPLRYDILRTEPLRALLA